MQLRKQGNRVQVLTYQGYDKVKKRAIVKMAGSYDLYSFKLSDGLLEKLTVEQKDELLAHIDAVRQAAKNKLDASLFGRIAYMINVADNIDFSVLTIDPAYLDGGRSDKVWRVLKEFEAKLETLGYPRPKRAYKARNVNVGAVSQQELITS